MTSQDPFLSPSAASRAPSPRGTPPLPKIRPFVASLASYGQVQYDSYPGCPPPVAVGC